MTTLNYITEGEYRDFIGSTTTAKTSLINSAILAASRMIDSHCGRYFYQQTTTKFVSPCWDDLYILNLGDDDLATTTALTVTVDFSGTGNYTESRTLNTDFYPDPINQSVNGVQGWPYTSLRATNGKIWPQRYNDFFHETVKIVGTFGWPAIPEPVKEATKIITNVYVKVAEAPLGVAGVNGWGDLKVQDPLVGLAESLLRPYRRNSTKFLVR